MRAFVTGATGFLGSRLLQRLTAQGHDVVCLTRTPPASIDTSAAALRWVHGTLARSESYRDALDGCDVVVHAAAELHGAPAVLFRTNVVATRALLDAAREAAVRRFVLVSSCSVYGTAALGPHAILDETCPLDPEPHRRDAYAYSKIAQEHAAWEAYRAGGPPLVVVRPGVLYGPGRDWISSRIGLWAGNVLIKMGGRQLVPQSYVDNCADALCRAAATPGIDGEAFNVVDDELATANALLREYRRRVAPLRAIPIPAWAIGPLSRTCTWYHEYSAGQLPAILSPYRSDAEWKRLRYSNEKAKRVLGWRPAVGLSEGLARVARSLDEREPCAS